MPKFTDTPILNTRYLEALTFAFQAHQYQIRKGDVEAPYFAHLATVSSLVLESGGSEDEAIAALLHDIIEDIEVDPRLIQEKFGTTVLNVVQELSEDKSLAKSQRKIFYVASVLSMSESALRISVADKLHNIRSYAATPELFEISVADFYRQLIANYRKRDFEPLDMQILEMEEIFEKLT